MKYVLVTGAYGGMGSATVLALRRAGYFVFALDRTVGEAAEGIFPIAADVTSEESLERAFSLVSERTEELYAILHFAGTYVLDSLLEMDDCALRRVFDINFFGVCRINRLFLPMLRRCGRIVITTSELAPLDPLPFTGIYAITKSALEKYAYSLRMEAQLLGITVTVLRPGAVRTAMLGASTVALNKFCENTALYACNAKRFQGIVESVEARNVPAERIAWKAVKILGSRRPRFVYSVNRNPLLLLLHMLPQRLQTWIIRRILR